MFMSEVQSFFLQSVRASEGYAARLPRVGHETCLTIHVLQVPYHREVWPLLHIHMHTGIYSDVILYCVCVAKAYDKVVVS